MCALSTSDLNTTLLATFIDMNIFASFSDDLSQIQPPPRSLGPYWGENCKSLFNGLYNAPLVLYMYIYIKNSYLPILFDNSDRVQPLCSPVMFPGGQHTQADHVNMHHAPQQNQKTLMIHQESNYESWWWYLSLVIFTYDWQCSCDNKTEAWHEIRHWVWIRQARLPEWYLCKRTKNDKTFILIMYLYLKVTIIKLWMNINILELKI